MCCRILYTSPTSAKAGTPRHPRKSGTKRGRLRRERCWICRLVEAGVLAAEVASELVVEDVGADLEQEAGAAGCPAHLLLLEHARSLAMISAGPWDHRGVGGTTDSRQVTRGKVALLECVKKVSQAKHRQLASRTSGLRTSGSLLGAPAILLRSATIFGV